MEALGEVPVAVLKVAGAHQLSGAVMNPSAIRELFPDDDSWPHYGEVPGERVYWMLNRKRSVPLHPMPPPFRNHGNYVISVAELNRWLGEKAEEAGAYILSETVGAKLLVEDDKVVGNRSGWRRPRQGGRGEGQLRARLRHHRQGDRPRRGPAGATSSARRPEPRPRGEGPAGVGARGQGGVEVEQPLDRVIHTLGWPLRARPSTWSSAARGSTP